MPKEHTESQRVALMILSGMLGSYLYTNGVPGRVKRLASRGVKAMIRELLMPGGSELMPAGKWRSLASESSKIQDSASKDTIEALKQLSSRLEQLSSDVNTIQAQTNDGISGGNGGSRRQYIISGIGSVGAFASFAALVGAAGIGYIWYKGYTVDEIVWVTKKCFTDVIHSLKAELESRILSLAKEIGLISQALDDVAGDVQEIREIHLEFQKELQLIQQKLDLLIERSDSPNTNKPHVPADTHSHSRPRSSLNSRIQQYMESSSSTPSTPSNSSCPSIYSPTLNRTLSSPASTSSSSSSSSMGFNMNMNMYSPPSRTPFRLPGCPGTGLAAIGGIGLGDLGAVSSLSLIVGVNRNELRGKLKTK